MKQLLSYLPSAVAIVVCAGLGSFVAHVIVDLTSWEGTLAAIATLLLSMVLAFGLFVAGAALISVLARNK
jgi:hypothetical protein